MPGSGVPFRKGHDPRRKARQPRTPGEKTVQQLAKAERENSIRALVALRDGADDEALQLKAAELLLCFADGKPGPAVAAPPRDEAEDDKGDDAAARLYAMPAGEETA